LSHRRFSNAEPAECFVCFREQVLEVFRFRHIALNRDRFSTTRRDLINHIIRTLSRRRVVEQHRRDFHGKLLAMPAPMPFEPPVTTATFLSPFFPGL